MLKTCCIKSSSNWSIMIYLNSVLLLIKNKLHNSVLFIKYGDINTGWLCNKYPPFEEAKSYCFVAVCLSVGRSTNNFRSFPLQRLPKSNLIYRFSLEYQAVVWCLVRSSNFWQRYVFGLWKKFQLFAVFMYFLPKITLNKNEMCYADLS